MIFQRKNIAFYLLGFFAILFGWITFTQNGLGKSGDSVTHYLMARHSWTNSIYFFNHWGKPFFTLLSSPFAQFGFTGIKVFNVILGLLSAFLTFKTAEKLQKPNSYISILTTVLSIYFIFKIFSGLTEYLSAFMLISAVYLILVNKDNYSACVVSFLPFVRSEGLVILCVFAVYFIVNGKYRSLIWLTLGHVVYSIVGYFWYYDIFWVFNKIPYATLSTIYGEGTWSHFFKRYIYIVGVPIYILLIIGLLQFFYHLFRKKFAFKTLVSVNSMLIYGLFGAFFIAHMTFWALSIFNSMGLLRVFITVVPLTAIIALDGLNSVSKLLPYKWFEKSVIIILVGYIVLFPVTSNPAALKVPEDFRLEDKYLPLKEYLEANKSTIASRHVYASEPHSFLFLDLAMHDSVSTFPIEDYTGRQHFVQGDYIIWDSWYSVIEENIGLEALQADRTLRLEHSIKQDDNVVFAIFVSL